jgi:hypothetical protein
MRQLAAADAAATGSLWWTMLVAGTAGTLAFIVLDFLVYRAYCRWGGGGLDFGLLMIDLGTCAAMAVGGWGAAEVIAKAPNGPAAGLPGYLLLLAGSLAVGGLLLWLLILNRRIGPMTPGQHPDCSAETTFSWPAFTTLGITAVLSLAGAAGITHFSLISTMAWSYVCTLLVIVAGWILLAFVFAASPGGGS